MEVIKSSDNKKIRLLRSLSNKKFRNKLGVYIAEGYNLIKDFKHIDIESLFIRESDLDKYLKCFLPLQDRTYVVDDVIFNKLTDTVYSNGILAIVKKHKPKSIATSFLIVLDKIRDPGNLGTIFRTCVAMGVEDFILLDCADPYSSKVVRASMGGVFHANVVKCKMGDFVEKTRDFCLCAMDMNGENIYTFDAPEKLALIIGSEAEGLSQELKKHIKKYLSIPMKSGKIESLNAAVACSIAVSTIININS